MRIAASFFLVASALTLNAQTDAPDTNTPPTGPVAAAATTPPSPHLASPGPASPQRPPTEISSDSFNYDNKSQIAVYIGNVIVKDPQMKLTCGLMTVKAPASGRIDSIVAEQDVVIDAVDNQGHPMHATSDKATYNYFVSDTVTNETITLTGHPYLKSENWWGTGDVITWDRLHGVVTASHPHMFILQETKGKTNASETVPLDLIPKK
jgi:lipopolysaccharide transport protein LptA